MELILPSSSATLPSCKHTAIVFKYMYLNYIDLSPRPTLQALFGVSKRPCPTEIHLFNQPLLVLLILVRSNGDEKRSYADWQWHIVGTTIVYIPTKAFNEYQKLTGGILDKATQLLKITPDQFNNLKSFFVFVNGVCVLSWVGGHWQCGIVISKISFPFSLGSIRINP